MRGGIASLSSPRALFTATLDRLGHVTHVRLTQIKVTIFGVALVVAVIDPESVHVLTKPQRILKTAFL